MRPGPVISWKLLKLPDTDKEDGRPALGGERRTVLCCAIRIGCAGDHGNPLFEASSLPIRAAGFSVAIDALRAKLSVFMVRPPVQGGF